MTRSWPMCGGRRKRSAASGARRDARRRHAMPRAPGLRDRGRARACGGCREAGHPMSPAWIVPAVTLTLTQVAVIATSIYLHRALAHRALHLHPVADLAFRTALWLTTGQSRQEWVAVHRKHHTFTDREGDPHSPRLLGFWRVQLLNVAYYMREARSKETLETFAPDLRPDRFDRAIFSHGMVGLGVGLTLL